ncbi:hypothetical protein [Clostridium magnum]|uniref:Uncharacterized protein n=1 Tax=Clostridium magnum DSM 2767 TaxID=1121326 RepID=A0A162QCG7_9CLOT|nr:hypothetical protein [Clostridium magnum]KZL88384.1 hypothetical protein CLMAG_63110 [Clostridium magnum DSM 2767]
MDNLQLIKSNQQSKYEEIIEYLSQDNGYWLENDIWDAIETFFIGEKISNMRYIDFSNIKNDNLKNEIKYFFFTNIKKNY